jgi:hypothetical protein
MSSPALLFFAAIVTPRLTPRVSEPDHRFSVNDMLIILSVALGTALLIVVWAVFFRKKKEEEYEYPESEEYNYEKSSGERRRRRKRKRRRRDHRPRNPTLEQTGGLPPPRPEDQPPPY